MLTPGLISEIFLSTPSAGRATRKYFERKRKKGYFYPRAPRGGRPWAERVLTIWGIFLSTPSARRATGHCKRCPQGFQEISIHALREEGDSRCEFPGPPDG